MASKDIKKLIKYGQNLGFKIKKTQAGHILFIGFGRRILSGSTPSDSRVITGLRRNLTKISQGKPVHRP